MFLGTNLELYTGSCSLKFALFFIKSGVGHLSKLLIEVERHSNDGKFKKDVQTDSI